jgi:hypothetical protein
MRHTPASAGEEPHKREEEAKQVHQVETLQYGDIQDALHTRLPGRHSKIRDDRLL